MAISARLAPGGELCPFVVEGGVRFPFVSYLPGDRLRASVWARFYQPPSPRWFHLFDAAPLRFAPGMTMELVPGDWISGSIAFTGFYDLKLSRFVQNLARQGGTLIDVGANLGYFSLLWVAANSGNRCLAFEPSPRVADLMTRNIERNGVGDRTTLLRQAAGRQAGSLQFDPGPPDQTGWGGLSVNESDDTVDVDVVRIDETVGAKEDVSLLKIDTEGADTWVLMGCERLLRNRCIRHIWFEQNKPRLRALCIRDDEALRFLSSMGYKVTAESEPGSDVVSWSAVPE